MFNQLIRKLIDRVHPPRVGFLHEPTAIATTIDRDRAFAEVSLDDYVEALAAADDGASATAIIPFTDGRIMMVGTRRDDTRVYTIMLEGKRALGNALARVVRSPGTNLVIEKPWWRTGAGIIRPPQPPPPPPTQPWLLRSVLPILDAGLRIVELDIVEITPAAEEELRR